MLDKKDAVVMREIYKLTANNNGQCLVRPVDLLAAIPYKYELTKEDCVRILQNLQYDGYFDMVETEKKGEFYFCITLKTKGFGFLRSEEQLAKLRKKGILTKVGLTLLGVLLTWFLRWIIGLIAK